MHTVERSDSDPRRTFVAPAAGGLGLLKLLLECELQLLAFLPAANGRVGLGFSK